MAIIERPRKLPISTIRPPGRHRRRPLDDPGHLFGAEPALDAVERLRRGRSWRQCIAAGHGLLRLVRSSAHPSPDVGARRGSP